MIDLEQLADQVRAEHQAQFKRRVKQVARGPFLCSRCGAQHERFRDRARTTAASWCARCFTAYMRARRETQRLTP
jgi:hypothetical protein